MVVASLLIRAGNWIAFLLGLPGDFAAWRSIAAVLGDHRVSIDPFFVRLFVADALLILGCVLLGPTLLKLGKKFARFSWERHKEQTRARRLFRWISEDDYQSLRHLISVGDIKLSEVSFGLRPFLEFLTHAGHESVWTMKSGMGRLARQLIAEREVATRKATPPPTTVPAPDPPSSPESSEPMDESGTDCRTRSEDPSTTEDSPESD